MDEFVLKENESFSAFAKRAAFTRYVDNSRILTIQNHITGSHPPQHVILHSMSSAPPQTLWEPAFPVVPRASSASAAAPQRHCRQVSVAEKHPESARGGRSGTLPCPADWWAWRRWPLGPPWLGSWVCHVVGIWRCSGRSNRLRGCLTGMSDQETLQWKVTAWQQR